MLSEGRYSEVLRSGNAPQESSFDEVARGLASGTLSRGQVLKMLGTIILGGLLVPGCSTMGSQEKETKEATKEATTEATSEPVEESANTPVEEPISGYDEYLETEGPIGEPAEEAIGAYEEYLDETGEGPIDDPQARTTFCGRCRRSGGECCTKRDGRHLCCQGGTQCTEVRGWKSGGTGTGKEGEGFTDYICR